MASQSGAFGAKCGYNQSAGGYYYIIDASLPGKLQTYSGGSGSGGATTVGSFAALVPGAGAIPANVSTVFGQGKLVRDMGKTVVSSGRAFRKVQGLALATNNSSPSFGVGGLGEKVVNSVDTGYLTAYVELCREGSCGTNAAGQTGIPAGLVRFM